MRQSPASKPVNNIMSLARKLVWEVVIMIAFIHRQLQMVSEPQNAVGRFIEAEGRLAGARPEPSSALRETSAPIWSREILIDRRDDHIVVVEPRAFLRDCIVRYLAEYTGASVGGCQSIADVIEERQETVFDLVILSAMAKTWQSTLDDVAKLYEAGVSCPIIVLVETCDPTFMQDALCRGLRGVVPVTFTADIAVEALRLVLAGGTFVPVDALMGYAKQRMDSSSAVQRQLTAREEQILAQLRLGKQNKQIAYDLSLSEGTVKVHIHNIMKKLGVSNRSQVIAATS
jgi:DNA-binding NarL/FixJ family response regulator